MGKRVYRNRLRWCGGRVPRQRRSLAEFGFDGFAEILHEMPAIRDLHGLRRALSHSGGVGFRPIPCHDCHLGMRLEPGRDGLGAAILEQIDRAAPLQINHDGAIGVPFPFGPIVNADGTWP
jgi:hypothetical protein